jgi:hypothetical protein
MLETTNSVDGVRNEVDQRALLAIINILAERGRRIREANPDMQTIGQHATPSIHIMGNPKPEKDQD